MVQGAKMISVDIIKLLQLRFGHIPLDKFKHIMKRFFKNDEYACAGAKK